MRRARLHRTEIVDAALQLLEIEGLNALTMRELGVEGMALYRHFPNKDAFALVDAVAAHLLERGGITGVAGIRTYHSLMGLVHGATMIELTLGEGPPELVGPMPTAETHPLVVANLDELMACIGGENLTHEGTWINHRAVIQAL